MKGTASSFASSFNIAAGIRSGNVALLPSNSLNSLRAYLDRNIMRFPYCTFGSPKYGQSIPSGGSLDFESKVFAKRSTLSFDESTQCCLSRSGEIEKHFAFLFKSSRFNRHHALLSFLNQEFFSFNFAKQPVD